MDGGVVQSVVVVLVVGGFIVGCLTYLFNADPPRRNDKELFCDRHCSTIFFAIAAGFFLAAGITHHVTWGTGWGLAVGIILAVIAMLLGKSFRTLLRDLLNAGFERFFELGTLFRPPKKVSTTAQAASLLRVKHSSAVVEGCANVQSSPGLLLLTRNECV